MSSEMLSLAPHVPQDPQDPQDPQALIEHLARADLESGSGDLFDEMSDWYDMLPEAELELPAAGDHLPMMETHARSREYLGRLIEQREAHAKAMLEEAKRRIELFRERAIAPVERARTWHETCLGRILAVSGQRRIDLVAGRVEFTPRREDLQKESDRHDDDIVAWLRSQGLEQAIRRKIEEAPDMRHVKMLWKTQGIVPPHMHVVAVGGTLKISEPGDLG